MEAVKRRFGAVEAVPEGHELEFLSDNGGAYIAADTRNVENAIPQGVQAAASRANAPGPATGPSAKLRLERVHEYGGKISGAIDRDATPLRSILPPVSDPRVLRVRSLCHVSSAELVGYDSPDAPLNPTRSDRPSQLGDFGPDLWGLIRLGPRPSRQGLSREHNPRELRPPGGAGVAPDAKSPGCTDQRTPEPGAFRQSDYRAKDTLQGFSTGKLPRVELKSK